MTPTATRYSNQPPALRPHPHVYGHLAAALVITSAFGIATPAAAAGRVLVLSPADEDARIVRVREAVAYWKDVFAELGLEPPFVDAGVAIYPAGARAIENFAWQISRLAGRLPDDAEKPPPPRELLAIDADVVVLLSTQPLLPFARPLGEPGRYLVAIPRALHSDDSGADSNVIAHELGHVLGLRHGADPGALMCEPCLTTEKNDEKKFRPISTADRARLIELHGSSVP
jgi:hypothetical protein